MNMTVISELERRHIPYELLPHKRTTTAADEAVALHLPAEEVAKTLVLSTPGGYVRALIPASRRLNAAKLAAVLEVAEVSLVSEGELVGAYPEFELGAVAPLAGPPHDRVVVDTSLREHPWIVFEAGRHDQSVRVRTGDFLAAANAVVAEIVLD